MPLPVPSPRLPFALLLAMGCALIVASDAWAQSCGHYVIVGSQNQLPSIVPQAGFVPDSAAKPSNPALPCPCSGPQCSGLPEGVPVPPAPPSGVTRLELALRAVADDVREQSVVRTAFQEQVDREVHRPSSILRPPR